MFLTHHSGLLSCSRIVLGPFTPEAGWTWRRAKGASGQSRQVHLMEVFSESRAVHMIQRRVRSDTRPDRTLAYKSSNLVLQALLQAGPVGLVSQVGRTTTTMTSAIKSNMLDMAGIVQGTTCAIVPRSPFFFATAEYAVDRAELECVSG